MNWDHGKVLLSNAVRHFVSQGGKLEYEYCPDGEQKRWSVLGITPAGDRLQVYIHRSGEKKLLKNANSVVNYHLEMCPTELGVFIPYEADDDGSRKPESDD